MDNWPEVNTCNQCGCRLENKREVDVCPSCDGDPREQPPYSVRIHRDKKAAEMRQHAHEFALAH